MATRKEIGGWIENARQKYVSYKRIAEECDEKIARLVAAYNEISGLKKGFRKAQQQTEEIFEQNALWSGERNDSFCVSGAAINNALGEYYQQLDAVHDAINVRIGELRAEKYRVLDLAGVILTKISQWRVAWENATN